MNKLFKYDERELLQEKHVLLITCMSFVIFSVILATLKYFIDINFTPFNEIIIISSLSAITNLPYILFKFQTEWNKLVKVIVMNFLTCAIVLFTFTGNMIFLGFNLESFLVELSLFVYCILSGNILLYRYIKSKKENLEN